MFQSAPHFSSEANFYGRSVQICERVVSIRASLQQRGELNYTKSNFHLSRFQSAPHFSSEANNNQNFVTRTWGWFQSAPHFSSEANSVPKAQDIDGLVFQSAPHFSSEANEKPLENTRLRRVVSIRASLQQRGEHPSTVRSSQGIPVSIRASLQQRGEHESGDIVRTVVPVSIRASLQQRGELHCSERVYVM